MRDTDGRMTVTLSVEDGEERQVERTFEIESITSAVDDDEFWALLDDDGMPRLILTLEEFEKIDRASGFHGEEEA